MKLYIKLIVVTFLFWTCSPKMESSAVDAELGSNGKKDEIDLYALFDDFDFYPLVETNHFSDEIKAIKVTGKEVFFIEKYSGKVFKLNLDSNNFSSLLRYGSGPGEVQEVSTLQIFNDRLFVLSKPQNKIMVFSSNGNLLDEKKLGFFPSDFSLHKGNLFFRNGFFENSGYFLRKADFDFENIDMVEEYPVIKGQMDFAYTGHLQGGYYSFPFDTKIYSIDDTNDKEVIRFLVRNPMPPDEIFDHQKINTYLMDLENPKNYLNKFIYGNKEGFFQFSIDNEIKYGVLLRSNEFYGTNDFLTEGRLFLLLDLPLAYSDGYFYCGMNPRFKDWFLRTDVREKIIAYYQQRNSKFAAFLATLTEDSPPVIIRFKLKGAYG
ncbi:MAG: 6-bladed beta-propeller [Mongoliitalea sp.]